MDEIQVNLQDANRPLSKFERFIADEINFLALFSDNGLDIKVIEDELSRIGGKQLSGSVIFELIPTMLDKATTEGEKLIDAISIKYKNKLHGTRKYVENIMDPDSDIYELIPNDLLDKASLGKYFVFKIKDCIVDVIKTFSKTLENELNLRDCETDKTSNMLCIYWLEKAVVTVMAAFTLKFHEKIIEINKDFRKELKVTKKELHKELMELSDERIKLLEDQAKLAKSTYNYDLLTQIDDMKIYKFDEDCKSQEVPYARYKKSSSIICKYASNSKKIEMIKTKRNPQSNREENLL